MSAPDGSLWIGLRLGGIYHWQAGRFTAHGPDVGLPVERTIFRFARGTDGRIWAGTTEGLFLYEDRRWRRAGAEFGLPDGFIFDIVADHAGTLWVAGPEGIFSLPAHGRQGHKRHEATPYGYLAALPDGGVWMSQTAPDPTHGGTLVPVQPSPGQPAGAGLRYGLGQALSRIMVDRDGGLWAAHRDQVMRLPAPQALKAWAEDGVPGQAQYFGVERGLSGAKVQFTFEDRDGAVWVSTGEGLDRFKRPRLLAEGMQDTSAGLGFTDDGRLVLCTGAQGVRTQAGLIEALAQAGYKCDAMDREPSGRRPSVCTSTSGSCGLNRLSCLA